MSEKRLTHLDDAGNARMVDVTEKAPTDRRAVARGRVRMTRETLELVAKGEAPKGDVFTVAKVAGIMAAKRTAETIPMCHPVPVTGVELKLWANFDVPAVEIEAAVRTHAPTGVEMEALAAVAAAALTVYDMCKSAEMGMVIEGVRLVEKSGGRRGDYKAPGNG